MMGEEDVTAQFSVKTQDGTLTIAKREVTIKPKDASKPFDGKPLTASDWEYVGETEFVEGQGIETISYAGSQTIVGESDSSITEYTLKENTNPDNYTIKKETGNLEVTALEEGDKLEITVVAKSDKFTYDGTQHSVSGFEQTEFEINGVKYTVSGLSASASGTPKVMMGEEDVTAQFSVKTQDGTLTIAKREVTITVADDSKVFGTEDPTFKTPQVENLVKPDDLGTVSVVRTNKDETVGTYTEVLNAVYTKNSNYDVKVVKGDFTITEQSIDKDDDGYVGVTINSPSDLTYDGDPHKWIPEVKDKDGNALKDTDYEVSYSTEDFTNVGEIKVTITGKGNYSGTVKRSYKITKREITLESASDSKIYDGSALTNSTVTLSGKIAKEGEVTYKAKGSQTTQGSSKNTIEVTYSSDTMKNNYIVNIIEGTLTVYAQSIDPEDPKEPDPENPEQPVYLGVTVNTPENKEYSGKEQKWIPEVKDKDGKDLVAGTDYEVSYSTEDFTNVTDKITVTITGKGNYQGEVTRTYQITPKDVTFTTESAEKVYDGTPLTHKVGSIIGLVEGEEATLVITGTITDAGEVPNAAHIEWDKTAKETNYNVTEPTLGTLTVTQQTINPDDPDDPDSYQGIEVGYLEDVVYNGESQEQKPTVTMQARADLVEGTDYTISFSEDTTNAGTVTVTVTGINNYKGSVERTYKILPREITITSQGATKTYDGRALTNGRVTITSGSLAKPNDLTYRAVGSQTAVGSSRNTIRVTFANETMEGNYIVTLEEGMLVVNALPVVDPDQPGGGEDNPTPGTGGDEGTGTDEETDADDADEDEEDTEDVEDDDTPLSDGEEDVDDGKTPLSKNDAWALINLIAAIITVLFGLILLLSKRHRNDDEEDEEERQARMENDEEKEPEQKRGWICKVLGVIVAIASVVLFILTEDMSLPMVLIDNWTIWMVVIAVVELVLLLVGRHWKDVGEDEEEQEA